MARTGLNNGFYFDKEIFTEYMQSQSCLNNLLIGSGVLAYDETINEALGSKGNVGTIPFFLPIDAEGDALNDDGATNNTPTTISGSKQTFMATARMKAWKQNSYVRYLTGVNPLQNLANNLVVPYYRNQWEKDIYAILSGVLGVSGMASHVTNIAVTTGTITDANKIGLTSGLTLGQKALGDNRDRFKIFVCHSAIATRLKQLELTTNIVYILPVTGEQVQVDVYNGMIVLETDTGTVDNTVADYPVYTSYMLGTGAILYCDKQVFNPYDTAYDPETNGGVEKFYTKQAKVLHPNGFSLAVDSITGESPTRTELGTAANWSLAFNHKLVPIAKLVTNG